MVKKIYMGLALVLVILTSSVYVLMPDKVRVDVENTKTKYSVFIDDKFILAATEYVYLYDGTTKMKANSRRIEYHNDSEYLTITRYATWKENISTSQRYRFLLNNTEIESFPLENTLMCLNCEGKIVQYEIRDILYEGLTKEISSPFQFGNNMKIEFDNTSYYSKVFQQKTDDKIIIKFRPTDDIEFYNVRLFDPPIDFKESKSKDTVNIEKLKEKYCKKAKDKGKCLEMIVDQSLIVFPIGGQQ